VSEIDAERIKETMDAKLPPSPKQNSGILAIQVHQLADLALPAKQRALKHGAKTDTHTPSTYAQVVSRVQRAVDCYSVRHI
jgi:hypothetical protein